MWAGKRDHDWSQTAELWALQANCNRDPAKRSKAYSARDLCPWLPEPPKKSQPLERITPREISLMLFGK